MPKIQTSKVPGLVHHRARVIDAVGSVLQNSVYHEHVQPTRSRPPACTVPGAMNRAALPPRGQLLHLPVLPEFLPVIFECLITSHTELLTRHECCDTGTAADSGTVDTSMSRVPQQTL